MAEENQAAAPAVGNEPVASGPITDTASAVDRIMGLLDDDGDEIKKTPEAPVAAAEGSESPEPGDTDPPEEASIGDEEAADPATPTIEPPQSWDKEAKEAFKALPPHLQQVVAEREKARDAEVRRGQNEVADQRKAIEAEQSKISTERTQYAQQLNNFLLNASQQFQDEFGAVDWAKLSREDPAAYVEKEFQFKQKQHTLNVAAAEQKRLNDQAVKDQNDAHTASLRREQELLVEKVPAFKDPTKAKQIKENAVAYLMDKGFTPAEISGLNSHRLMMVVLDALEVTSVRATRAKTATKVAAAPPRVAEPTKPGPSKGEKTAADRTALVRQMSKARSTDDQAAILLRALS